MNMEDVLLSRLTFLAPDHTPRLIPGNSRTLLLPLSVRLAAPAGNTGAALRRPAPAHSERLCLDHSLASVPRRASHGGRYPSRCPPVPSQTARPSALA